MPARKPKKPKKLAPKKAKKLGPKKKPGPKPRREREYNPMSNLYRQRIERENRAMRAEHVIRVFEKMPAKTRARLEKLVKVIDESLGAAAEVNAIAKKYRLTSGEIEQHFSRRG
jgi:hypothetical protein